MRQRWQLLRDWIDTRTTRERGLILATTLVAIACLWSVGFADPVERRRQERVAGLDEGARHVEALELEAGALAERLARSPEARLREQAARLEGEIATLDAHLAEQRLGLVPASETARILEELLGREPGLRLLRLETADVQPVVTSVVSQSEGASGEVARLFRHELVVELEGGYLAALRYLEAVQAIPWRLYWDELDYRVVEHPRARIRLRLHTLSFEEAWIGV